MENVQNESIVSFSNTTLSKPCSVERKRFFSGPKSSEYSGAQTARPPPPHDILDDVIPFPKVKWRKCTGNDTITASILTKSACNDRQTPTHAHTTWGGATLLLPRSHVSYVDTQQLHVDSSDRHTNIRLVYIKP